MATVVTRTLENQSGEATESLTVTPFDRDGWTEVSRGPRNGGAYIEHRIAGETPEYPLTRVASVRPGKLYHPATPDQVHNGHVFNVDVFSTIEVDDSANGIVGMMPVRTSVQIGWAGGTLVLPADVLQQAISTLAELWNSITTGTPDSTVINRIAQASAELD